ncbi:MAG: ATP-binding protein [Verrucomicrobiales bacterium]|nr:ATP-binding protein [Verrucomicrobiales bacterium]
MTLVSEYRLRNDPTECQKLPEWIEAFTEQAKLSSTARNAFDLALVEWLANILAYAYDDSSEHSITLRLFAGPGQARAEIRDDGREFNPLSLPTPDVHVPLEDRPIGGLGIHMIRQLMDSVEYRRDAGHNILTLTRRSD